MTSNIKIFERTTSGKREVRKLRHEGFVPGIIYGDNKEPTKVSVGEKELLAECYTLAFFGHIIEVNLGKTKEKILPRAISFDPVTDKPLHIDFQRVSKDAKIKISVPVETINEEKCPGIKKGGIINFVVHQLECFCSPDNIPEKILLDLSGKEIGESFLLENTILPEGVFAVNAERDAVLATLVGAKVGGDKDETSAESSSAENSEAASE